MDKEVKKTYWLKTHNYLPSHKEHFSDEKERRKTLLNIIQTAQKKYHIQLEKAAKREIEQNKNSDLSPSFSMQDLAKNWKGFTQQQLDESVVLITLEGEESLHQDAFPENLGIYCRGTDR